MSGMGYIQTHGGDFTQPPLKKNQMHHVHKGKESSITKWTSVLWMDGFRDVLRRHLSGSKQKG